MENRKTKDKKYIKYTGKGFKNAEETIQNTL